MTEHLDVEKLADYTEGLLDRDESARVQRHLAECPSCTEQHAALGDVSAYLSALPPPPMPPDVATRIEAAIEEEARARSSQGATATAPPDGAPVIPLRPRSRRWIAPLTAAAAVVVVVGGGFAVARQVAGSSNPGDSNVEARNPAPSQALPKVAAPNMTNSGTQYAKDRLGAQVNSVVKESESEAGGLRPKTGRETPPPSLPSSIAGCVNRISAKAGASPLLVDRGTYQGRQVRVLVFGASGTPARYDVWIVGSGCSASSDGVVTHTTVPRHR